MKINKFFLNIILPVLGTLSVLIIVLSHYEKITTNRHSSDPFSLTDSNNTIPDFTQPSDIRDHDIRIDLLSKVDIIPVPLALVQAANESAWGTSRFAKLGNNMFGQWSFAKGEGIVPDRRDAGATHKVATFNSINKSVSSYMQNLNTGKSYAELRKLRSDLRLENKELEADILATGLTKYSPLGQKYVNILCSMLKSNAQYL